MDLYTLIEVIVAVVIAVVIILIVVPKGLVLLVQTLDFFRPRGLLPVAPRPNPNFFANVDRCSE